MINVTKIINQRSEVEIKQFGLYGQMMFKEFESFSYQSQEKIQGKQKQVSKISKVRRKLPKIGKDECFKFNSKVYFSMQREALKHMGASENGSMFIGADSLEKLIRNRILKAIGREIPFEDNLKMRKGKMLEVLGFREFVRMHASNIEVLHKNKYANGVDKYNYFKKFRDRETLVGSTIDGCFVSITGEAELLENKVGDNLYLKSAAFEYNKTGNFLENKYFFKYYVQVQMQLLYTGLNKGNLFFIIDDEAINCVIDRDDNFISAVMTEVSRLERDVNNIAKSLKSKSDIDIKNIELDELSVIIGDFLKESFVYQELCDINFKFKFLEFVKSSQLEINGGGKQL
ncbi:BppA (plasmid) [Borrelia parkeri]|uniref:BppA n=1 Tax=Borrelia parkeri TaxID=141 RepID=UPI001FF30AD4|nr:BppA [Borrelia parkeri]UPA11500.1 BppA [Borrelia parkeri]